MDTFSKGLEIVRLPCAVYMFDFILTEYPIPADLNGTRQVIDRIVQNIDSGNEPIPIMSPDVEQALAASMHEANEEQIVVVPGGPGVSSSTLSCDGDPDDDDSDDSSSSSSTSSCDSSSSSSSSDSSSSDDDSSDDYGESTGGEGSRSSSDLTIERADRDMADNGVHGASAEVCALDDSTRDSQVACLESDGVDKRTRRGRTTTRSDKNTRPANHSRRRSARLMPRSSGSVADGSSEPRGSSDTDASSGDSPGVCIKFLMSLLQHFVLTFLFH